jgi:hypothetical protein
MAFLSPFWDKKGGEAKTRVNAMLMHPFARWEKVTRICRGSCPDTLTQEAGQGLCVSSGAGTVVKRVQL